MLLDLTLACESSPKPHKGNSKSLLRVDTQSELNGEHIIMSLLTSREGRPQAGKFYRLTLEEIPCPQSP